MINVFLFQVALFPPSDKTAETSVNATVADGVVDLRYVEHPVNQALLSTVSSHAGRVSVEHTEAFEVCFFVSPSQRSV